MSHCEKCTPHPDLATTHAHTHSPCSRAHVFHITTCTHVCNGGLGCPRHPTLRHHSCMPRGAGRAPAHHPLHAHQHVGQIFHFEVHQREQRWADCKEGHEGGSGAGWGCRVGRPEGGGGGSVPPGGWRLVPPGRDEPASPTRPGPHSGPQCLSLSRLVLAPPPPPCPFCRLAPA